jgi:long-chain acyl-CoA synthetase
MSDSILSREAFPWLAHYDAGVPASLGYEAEPLCALLDRAADENPRQTACLFRNYRITYRELRDQAEIMAANLRLHGLNAQDKVSIMLPNLPQTVLSFWAALKAGGVVVMTNPLYMEKELVRLFTDSGVRFVISVDLCWPKLNSLRDRLGVEKYFITSLADALRFPLNWLYRVKARRNGTARPVPYDNEKILPYASLLRGSRRLAVQVDKPTETLALLQYTGGTTGEPKGVMLTHANLTFNVEQALSVLHTLRGKPHIFAALLPFFHVYGLSTCLLVPTALRAALIVIPRYEPGELLRLIAEHKVTLFPGAPSIYLSLMQHKEFTKHDLSSIQYCISGSAPIPASALERFQNLTGCKIIEGYGLTESSPITHLTPTLGKQKLGSIGMPLPDTEARIVDMEVGALSVPQGKMGELIVRGPQVMRGYHNSPDETAGALRNNWLYTGDIAYMDEDGYFFIVDRKKDMVIVGGYNVYPREIDDVLLEHPKIKEAVAVAVLHPTRGETLKAYVVPKPGAELTAAEVVGHCRRQLANYKVPRQVEFRESLPRTITGKVLRRALRLEEMEKYSRQADYVTNCPQEHEECPADGKETGEG